MGPLNNAGVAAKVASHVSDALARGARPLIGGRPAAGHRHEPLYFEPTVLTGVPRGCADQHARRPSARWRRCSPSTATRRPSSSPPTIATGWSRASSRSDIDRAFRYIDEMPTGIVNINDTSNYWELHIPFGGLTGKDSGTGRVGGRHALTAMCDLKTATFSVA